MIIIVLAFMVGAILDDLLRDRKLSKKGCFQYHVSYSFRNDGIGCITMWCMGDVTTDTIKNWSEAIKKENELSRVVITFFSKLDRITQEKVMQPTNTLH